VRSQVEERRVESDRAPSALQHRAFDVVIEQDARNAAEKVECFDMAAQEAGHGGAEIEAQEDLARPAQHHDEGEKGPTGLTDRHLAEVPPIDLPLLARQRPQAQEGLGRRAGTVTGDDRAEVVRGAGIASRLDHRMEPTGTQPRVLPKRLDDEGDVGIDHRRPRRDEPVLQSGLCEHAPDGGVMMTELGGDRAGLPLLGVMQAEDLRLAIAAVSLAK
jgi:hypothetical protein